jgi:hypothetical protein
MTKDETLDMALEALKMCRGLIRNNIAEGVAISSPNPFFSADVDAAITAIKQARSAPVQERVAIPHEWRKVLRKLAFMARTSGGTVGHDSGLSAACEEAEALLSKPYTTPPAAQRQWVGLTDRQVGEVIDDVHTSSQYGHHHTGFWLDFYRAIDAKLKKENT